MGAGTKPRSDHQCGDEARERGRPRGCDGVGAGEPQNHDLTGQRALCRDRGGRGPFCDEKHQYQRAAGERKPDQATCHTRSGAMLQPSGYQDGQWWENEAEDEAFHTFDASTSLASDGADFGAHERVSSPIHR
ncbi:hypothetical protein GCM10009740_04000 [Terrabacter terrae]|uniref:Uncharacterized protein n=1 Tax=Terrabacter terrae TaxID=318434 RepID=A0ABN2TS29_9MICO